jgi:hypothetical protein
MILILIRRQPRKPKGAEGIQPQVREPKDAGKPPEARSKQEKLLLQLSGGAWPSSSLIFRLLASRAVRLYISDILSTLCVGLHDGSPSKRIQKCGSSYTIFKV